MSGGEPSAREVSPSGVPSITLNSTHHWPRKSRKDEILYDLMQGQAKISEDHNIPRRFWPFQVLSQILTKSRISKALAEQLPAEETSQVAFYVDKIGPVYNDEADIAQKGPDYRAPPEQKRYLRIFGILVIISKVEAIGDFIRSNIGDDDLPLLNFRDFGDLFKDRDNDEENIRTSTLIDGKAIGFLHEWPHYQLDLFDEKQWQFLTPFFSMNDHIDSGKTVVRHYKLSPRTILPWIEVKDKLEGGYSMVQRVTADPGSYDFHMAGNSILYSDFAIKSLEKSREEENFVREVEVLKRFAGASSDFHIVRLFCTFERDGINHMVFPWAECNLYEYWRRNPTDFTSTDIDNQRWIFSQLVGLAGGLNIIHNPGDTFGEPVLYGRHGDIKPDNILWFKSAKESQGVFLLADFGVTELHVIKTGDRERTTDFGFSVSYRPPEIDIAGKKLSRSLDIWSLGCMFLEMACWLLGGFEEVEKFSKARLSIDTSWYDLTTDAFFDVRPSQNNKGDFSVKRQVSEYIADLHRRHNCTMIYHEFLDLIQKNMLRVDGTERYQSDELLDRLRHMHKRAMDDQDYVLKPCPSEREEVLAPVTEAPIDLELRELLLNDRRSRMSQRFSMRTNKPRQSIRLRERTVTTIKEHNALPLITVLSPDGQASSTDHGTLETLTTFNQKVPIPESHRKADKGITNTRFEPVLFEAAENSSLQKTNNVFDGAQPANDLTAITDDIDAIVRKSLVSSGTASESYKVAFQITWQLQQCIRDELDGDPDLGSILTVTGTSRHAWATSCLEYIQTTWKEAALGEQYLLDLEILLGKEFDLTSQQPVSRLHGRLCSIEEESSGVSTLVFQGSVVEISILGQFLSWIAATFRIPQPDLVTSSYMDFREITEQYSNLPTYQISLKALRSLDGGPGTCWKPLFPSTVMACGFPVSICSGIQGLQILFDSMLEMAEILYDVNLESDDSNDAGVYFDGISYMLYPTAYIEAENVIQWHLESKDQRDGRNRDRALAPDSGTAPKWKRISDLEILRSATTVLGYCSDVQVQLGTAERAECTLLPSLARLERPPPEVSGGSVSLAVGFKGFVTGNATATIKTRNGLKRATELRKERTYLEVLNQAEQEPVILQDTEPGNERAWMVSELSLILELYNVWALKNGVKIGDIKFARPGPNGGAEARAVLGIPEYATKPVVVKKVFGDESDRPLTDIIKGIWGQIQQCIKENSSSDGGPRGSLPLGRTSIVGWDLLDLVESSSTICYRRELEPGRSQPCWKPFTKIVPVFFGQRMGEIIKPAPQAEVCRQWYPMPGGLEMMYLTASVYCLHSLAKRFGHFDPWFFFDHLVWRYKGHDLVFQPCDKCLDNAKVCVKETQILEEIKPAVLKKRPGAGPTTTTLQVEDNGAVVFSLKRKTIKT